MRTGTILFAEEAQPPAGDKADNKDQTPMWGQFLPFIMIAVMAYLLLIAPNRRERQRMQQMLGGLKKNDEVLTSSGILGVVTSIKETGDEVTIKSDETKLRVLKSSIVRIMNNKETPAAPAQGQAPDTAVQPGRKA